MSSARKPAGREKANNKAGTRARQRIEQLLGEQVRLQGGIVVIVFLAQLAWSQIPNLSVMVHASFQWAGLALMLGLLVLVSRSYARRLASLYEHAVVDLERELQDQVSRVNVSTIMDKTTGVFTYEAMESRIEEEMDRAHRYAHPITLVIVDLQQFHFINERHGRVIGNQILRRFALNILRNAVRTSDVIARFGGDEFAIVLPETGTEQAATVLQRLEQAALRGTILPNGQRVALPIVCGVASYPRDGANTLELIRAAERALLKAKETLAAREAASGQQQTAKR